MSERVAIVGSRRFPALWLVRAFIADLPPGTIVVSGGASGVVTAAAEAAKDRSLSVVEYHADWDGLGRKAGPIRNHRIVMDADRIVAFWDGVSRGTLNSVRIAHDLGKPVQIIDADGQAVTLTQALSAASALKVRGAITDTSE